jgi:quinol monooxygenase YgiN
MYALYVSSRVRPEFIDAFREASIKNASLTLLESGALRFDVMQRADDPTQFIFIEAYNSQEDHLRHRETLHFLEWRKAVEPMMAEARSAVQFTPSFLGEK